MIFFSFLFFSSFLTQISARRERKKEDEEEERRILLANSCDAGWDLENSICGGAFPERGAGE